MNRKEAVLAAMAASHGAVHSPVQIQKLMFLLDRNVPNFVNDGPQFDFQPYDYGPYDRTVYNELEALAEDGSVEIIEAPDLRRRSYRLTPLGQERGDHLITQLGSSTAAYAHKLSEFVRRLTFAQLVSTIYRKYPEMKVNSVFRG
jgi:uncharacterized protein